MPCISCGKPIEKGQRYEYRFAGRKHEACPEPNESPSSPRTRGSSTAKRAKELEGTGSQLAPVLRPLACIEKAVRDHCDLNNGMCQYCDLKALLPVCLP